MSSTPRSNQLVAVDFEGPITDGIGTVTTFLPKLLGFLVILLVGYVIARAVATVLDKVLERVGFDEAVEKGPVKQALSRSKYDASDIIAKLAFYAIFIPFLSAAVSTLGIAALEQPMAQFIALIPRIIVAVILVVIGGVVAGAVKRLVDGALGGLSYGPLLANGLSVLVVLIFLKSALDQVGIATTVTGPILIAILATVGGILVVGVGGALIKPMQHRLENAISKASDEASTAREQVRANAGTASTTGYDDPAHDTASSVRVR